MISPIPNVSQTRTHMYDGSNIQEARSKTNSCMTPLDRLVILLGATRNCKPGRAAARFRLHTTIPVRLRRSGQQLDVMHPERFPGLIETLVDCA